MFISTSEALPFTFTDGGRPVRNRHLQALQEMRLFRMWPDSELFSDIAWDHERRTLWVVIGDAYYGYLIRDYRVALEFLTAKSKGQFYNHFIKGRYPVAKIVASNVVTTPRLRCPVSFQGGLPR